MIQSNRYVIEICECGVWDTLDECDSMEDALTLASHYAELNGEDKIRISTPDNQIL